MTQSLYDQLGGAPAVDAAVDIFYRKVLSDDRISHYFDTVDMEAQHAKQKGFLTFAFGGPNNYTGKDMRTAHAKMNLTEDDFNAVLGHLQDTLRELGVGEEGVESASAVALSVKDEVLNR